MGENSEKEAGGRFWMKPRHVYGWEGGKKAATSKAGRAGGNHLEPHDCMAGTPRRHPHTPPRSQESFMGEEGIQNLPKLQARCDGEDEEEGMRDGMVTSSSVLYL